MNNCYFAAKDAPCITSSNLNLHDIVTPIKVDIYKQYLFATNFDRSKAQYLVNGFTEGFDTEYRGPLCRKDYSNNIPITVSSEQEMWDKLMKEVELGRHIGPFMHIPFEFFIQSPIGLVPKAGNKTRLIFHLSFNFKNYKNFNHYTPAEFCTVKYNDLDCAIKQCLILIENSGIRKGEQTTDEPVNDAGKRDEALRKDIQEHVLTTIFMSKTDLNECFQDPSGPSEAKKVTHHEVQVPRQW